MPIYRYRAVSAAGEVAVGELDAANESEIVDRLRDQGLMPMQIAHATGVTAASAARRRQGGKRRRRLFESKTVTRDQLLALTRELATLLQRGPAARSRARDPHRSRAHAAGGHAAAGRARRRARRQGAVAGARCAARDLLALLREHRARGRGGRRARRGAAAAVGHDGAQQGAARDRSSPRSSIRRCWCSSRWCRWRCCSCGSCRSSSPRSRRPARRCRSRRWSS